MLTAYNRLVEQHCYPSEQEIFLALLEDGVPVGAAQDEAAAERHAMEVEMEAERRAEQVAEGAWLRAAESHDYSDEPWWAQ